MFGCNNGCTWIIWLIIIILLISCAGGNGFGWGCGNDCGCGGCGNDCGCGC